MKVRRAARLSLLAAAAALTATALAVPVGATPDAAASRAPVPDQHCPQAVPGHGQNKCIDREVRAVMRRMSLPEKVGQMFVSYAYGTNANTEDPTDVAANHQLYGNDVDNAAQLIDKYHLGGIIYFTWSNTLSDPYQIAGLSNGVQRAGMAQSTPIPLLISADQEGGIVTRIGAPASVSPGNMAIGATFRPDLARSAAAVTGTELRAMGIDVDDAPVVDVNTNPQNAADGPRSFGDRAGMVSRFAAAAVRGYQQPDGVAAQAKHFPGLGDTTVNTDNGVAVTHETRAQIMRTDIPPFRAAIRAGVDSIMAAHIVAPALDPSGAPASLSKPIVTGLLRHQLGYDGLVYTDALSAGALANISPNQVVLRAINAGDDELLMPPNLPSAVQAVLHAVRSGTISRARIDQSVYRILRLKFERGLFRDPYTNAAAVKSTVGTAQHLQTMARIAQRSITLLKNGDHVLPLAARSGKHVLVTGWGVSTTQNLAGDLSAKGLTIQVLWTGSPDQKAIDAAVAAAKQNDVTVVTTNNAWADPTQQQLVRALLATGKPIVVAAVGGPYDIAYFPSAPTYLATYGYQPVSMTALANTLVGADPAGRLPVTIPTAGGHRTLFPYGAGIGYHQQAG